MPIGWAINCGKVDRNDFNTLQRNTTSCFENIKDVLIFFSSDTLKGEADTGRKLLQVNYVKEKVENMH